MILVVMLWITGCFVVILHCSWILRGTEYPDDKYMGRFIVLSGDGMSEGEMENGTKVTDVMVESKGNIFDEANVESRIALVDEGGIDNRVTATDETNITSRVVMENSIIGYNHDNSSGILNNPTDIIPSLHIINAIHPVLTSILQPEITHSPPKFNVTPLLDMIHQFQQQWNSSVVFETNRHHFILGGIPYMRAPWLYASDVCYNPATTVYSFYTKSPPQFPKSSWFNSTRSPIGFQFGWNFKYVPRSPPTDVSWVEEPVAVSQAFTPRHIYHFAESVNQLILVLYYPSQYPPVCVSMFSYW